jgi:type IV fimbrial biogenesis protein FimT
VTALQADGATAANTVTFNAFGRVVDATAISRIDIDNETSGGDYRALRILVGTGGTVRMCDVKVTDNNDPRKC